MFETYTLRYLGSGNTDELLQTLSIAMQGENETEKKLEFCFSNSVDSDFFYQILTKYKMNIVTLEIPVKRRLNDLLVDPDFKFDNLENLSLEFISGECMFRLVVENLLNIHSDQLKFIKIDGLTVVDEESLVFKDFIALNYLSLNHVNDGLAFNLLSHCKETLRSLHLNNITFYNDYNPTVASELYKLPNLSHLYLENVIMNSEESDVFGFIEHNANHLVALSLDLVEDSNMSDFQWPTFSRLKYLMLVNTSELNPIMSKCDETLECLVIRCEDFLARDNMDGDNMDGIRMPRLKDFYTRCVNSVFLKNMLSLNSNSLEFICVDGDIFANECQNIKFKNLKTILNLLSPEDCSNVERAWISSWCPDAQICNDERGDLWKNYIEEFTARCRNIRCSSLFRDKALLCLP